MTAGWRCVRNPRLPGGCERGMLFGGIPLCNDSPAMLLLRQQLLEQIQRPRIVRLTKPEQRFLADLRILVRARHRNECRHAFFPRSLRESEYRLLPHLTIYAVVDDDVFEIRRRRIAR